MSKSALLFISQHMLIALVLLMCASGVCAGSSAPDLSQMSIEDLLNIQVTSVSRKAESISDSAAAVYVITQEDIRRGGVTSIADALRMVPGLHVANINSHIWAIGPRGFNDRFANKMLVLIDGRSVYTPLFAGTWWDVQDTLLEDVERIEVIRGPGATMWGANAVNGVVNIITKQADGGSGLMMTSDSGSANKLGGSLRFSGGNSATGGYRLYAKYLDHNDFVDSAGQPGDDSWRQTRTGFRMDKSLSGTDSLSLHGDVYNGYGSQRLRANTYTAPFQPTVVDSYKYSGANMLARWTRTTSSDSEMAVQMYVDQTKRNDLQHMETRDTWDLELQNRRALSGRRELIWGLGYRLTSDSTVATSFTTLDPASESDQLFSAFAQENIALIPDKLHAIMGSKLEHNDYSGFEMQPSVRMLWTPNERNTFWTAVSRAARVPTRAEQDTQFILRVLPPGVEGLPYVVTFVNNPDFDSEKLTAYELGYRYQPGGKWSLDLATYYHDYHDIRMLYRETPYVQMTPVPSIVVPFRWVNLAEAQTYGAELSANWQVQRSWRVALGFSWQKLAIQTDPTAGDPYTGNADISLPRHQASLRSYVDLPHNMEFDTVLYYVDEVRAHSVPAYVRCDLRLGWHSKSDYEISLALQNAFDSQHPEFGGTLSELPMEVPRTVYLKMTKQY